MKHLALIPVGESIEEEDVDEQKELDLNDRSISRSNFSGADIQTEVTSIYESYASLYPNPSLIKENQERDALVRALSAASKARDRNATPRTRSGFFGFLWGRANNSTDQGDGIKVDGVEDEYDRHILLEPLEENLDDGLCGTKQGLDLDCIPREAHAIARFSMASKCHRQINISRNTWERAGSSLVIITGLGKLVEFAANEPVAEHQSTSDRQALLQHIAIHGIPFHLEYVRASMVGPNVLIVSWGLPDGLVVVYRRTKKENNDSIAWHSVAASAPTRQVFDNLQDVFAGDDMSSALLLVTDVFPLVLEMGDDLPAVTLAISRLGGYFELVPLSARIWYGPELQHPNRNKASRPRKGNPQNPEHYATGLQNLSHSPRVLAITTSQYHEDVMGLASFRTRASTTSTWNKEMYPHNPQASFVLLAHGVKEGAEMISFWSVGIQHAEHRDPKDAVGFSLHCSVLEVLDLGSLGPPLTIFANREIFRFWRKARVVKLAQDGGTAELQSQPSAAPITTISVSKPIIDIQCCVSKQAVLIFVLDENGGATYMDCSRLERLASHTLNYGEYTGLFRNEDPSTTLPLVHILADRAQIASLINPTMVSLKQKAIASLFLPREFASAFDDRPVIAVVTESQLFLCSLPDVETDSLPVSVAIPETKGGFAVRDLLRQGVVFVFRRVPERTLCFATIQKQSPADIVRTLERRGDLKEALQAANRLGLQERESISETVERVKQQLWENEGDLSALRSISDDTYVISQALGLSEATSVWKHSEELDDLRLVLQLGLERLSLAPPGTSFSLEGKLTMTEAISKIRSTYILLGTYQLLARRLGVDVSASHFLSSFVSVSIEDLACRFAENANISSLAMLLIRHWDCLTLHCEWLLQIPPTLPTSDYALCIPAFRGRKVIFISNVDTDELADIMAFPKHLLDHFGVHVVVDDADKNAVMDSLFDFVASPNWDVGTKTLIEAYASRIFVVQQFTGSLEFTFQFSRAALLAIGDRRDSRLETTDTINRIHERVNVLRNMLTTQPDIESLPSHIRILNPEFLKNNLRELLSLANDMGDNWRGTVQVLDTLRPLIAMNGEGQEVAETAIAYCTDMLESVFGVSKKKLFRFAGMNAAIAFLSRTSLPVQKRLIKDKIILVDFAAKAVEKVFLLLERISLPMTDFKNLLGLLWVVYESLPAILPGENSSGGGEFMVSANHICSLLSAFDLIVAWEDSRILEDYIRTHNDSKIGRKSAAERLAVSLCQSFLSQTSSSSLSLHLGAAEKLLLSLLSDLRQLARIFDYERTLSVLITNNLFIPLVKAHDVELLGVALAENNDMFDSHLFSNAVISITSHEAYSKEDPDVAFLNACRNVLIHTCPELSNHFDSIQRSVKSAKYLNLFTSKRHPKFSPADLKEYHPIELVELLLTKFPDSIVVENDEWSDPLSAAILNDAIRKIIRSETEDDQNPEKPNPHLPRLPGQAVFRLAEDLGLVNETEVILVKCRTMWHALLAGFHGAGAALCRSILNGDLAALGKKPEEMMVELIRSIQAFVSCEEYEDLVTKRELCDLALSFPWTNLSGSAAAEYEKMLTEWSLGYYPYLASLDMNSTFRIFHQDTLSQHSVDVVGIYDSVARKARDKLQDDSMLAVLAKYSILWCVGSIDEHDEEWTGGRRLSTIGNDGFSLVLQIYDQKTRCDLLDRITKIINSDQTNDDDKEYSGKADEEIVRLLRQRGLSQNGAIRAASSSPHVTFNEAFEWAVKHSLDPNFNDPILILKSSARRRASKSGKRLGLQFLDKIRRATQKKELFDVWPEKKDEKAIMSSNVSESNQLGPDSRPPKPAVSLICSGIADGHLNAQNILDGQQTPNFAGNSSSKQRISADSRSGAQQYSTQEKIDSNLGHQYVGNGSKTSSSSLLSQTPISVIESSSGLSPTPRGSNDRQKGLTSETPPSKLSSSDTVPHASPDVAHLQKVRTFNPLEKNNSIASAPISQPFQKRPLQTVPGQSQSASFVGTFVESFPLNSSQTSELKAERRAGPMASTPSFSHSLTPVSVAASGGKESVLAETSLDTKSSPTAPGTKERPPPQTLLKTITGSPGPQMSTNQPALRPEVASPQTPISISSRSVVQTNSGPNKIKPAIWGKPIHGGAQVIQHQPKASGGTESVLAEKSIAATSAPGTMEGASVSRPLIEGNPPSSAHPVLRADVGPPQTPISMNFRSEAPTNSGPNKIKPAIWGKPTRGGAQQVIQNQHKNNIFVDTKVAKVSVSGSSNALQGTGSTAEPTPSLSQNAISKGEIAGKDSLLADKSNDAVGSSTARKEKAGNLESFSSQPLSKAVMSATLQDTSSLEAIHPLDRAQAQTHVELSSSTLAKFGQEKIIESGGSMISIESARNSDPTHSEERHMLQDQNQTEVSADANFHLPRPLNSSKSSFDATYPKLGPPPESPLETSRVKQATGSSIQTGLKNFDSSVPLRGTSEKSVEGGTTVPITPKPVDGLSKTKISLSVSIPRPGSIEGPISGAGLETHASPTLHSATPSVNENARLAFSEPRQHLLGKYLGNSFAKTLKMVSPVKLSPSERSSFRQRGQEFLQKVKGRGQGSDTPEKFDRQRLLEQGRRLLQKAREGNVVSSFLSPADRSTTNNSSLDHAGSSVITVTRGLAVTPDRSTPLTRGPHKVIVDVESSASSAKSHPPPREPEKVGGSECTSIALGYDVAKTDGWEFDDNVDADLDTLMEQGAHKSSLHATSPRPFGLIPNVSVREDVSTPSVREMGESSPVRSASLSAPPSPFKGSSSQTSSVTLASPSLPHAPVPAAGPNLSTTKVTSHLPEPKSTLGGTRKVDHDGEDKLLSDGGDKLSSDGDGWGFDDLVENHEGEARSLTPAVELHFNSTTRRASTTPDPAVSSSDHRTTSGGEVHQATTRENSDAVNEAGWDFEDDVADLNDVEDKGSEILKPEKVLGKSVDDSQAAAGENEWDFDEDDIDV